MSLQDPIADMFTRIRNALQAKLPALRMPSSKLKLSILKVLLEEGYIEKFETKLADTPKPCVDVYLKYHEHVPVIESIRRVSKPSLRKYFGYADLPKVHDGLGISIVSTPKGVMSDKQARSQKLGGEVLGEVI